MFPKGIAVNEDSPLKDAIKERKKKKPSSKVQADSLQLKMRDIIKEAIIDLGNLVSFEYINYIDEFHVKVFF